MYVRKRTGKDIWRNLYEFVLIETKGRAGTQKVLSEAERNGIIKKNQYKISSVSSLYTQQLSHQKINGNFIRILLKSELPVSGSKAVSLRQLSHYPFPRLINAYFEKEHLSSGF
jgi:A/G-specific adenine glycosylase